MTNNEIIQKNLDLNAEWMRYTFEHPDIIEDIPTGAHLVIIPNDDPVMAKENMKIVRKLKSQHLKVVIVHIDSPKPITAELEVA